MAALALCLVKLCLERPASRQIDIRSILRTQPASPVKWGVLDFGTNYLCR